MRNDVIDKATGNTVDVSGNAIDLARPSIVRLDLDRSQIASFEREGNNLVIRLINGEVIRVDNFYVQANGAGSDLVLREADRSLWITNTTAQGAARFSALHSIDDLLIAGAEAAAGGGGGALLPALLGAAGVAGGAAALSGGGSSDSGSRPVADTTPPGPPTVAFSANGAIVSGTGEAGATITIRDAAGNVLGTGIVGSNGSYSVTLAQPQANGQSVTVTQTDAAGNVSAGTAGRGPDITAPNPPTGALNDAGTVMTGNGEPGATVTIRNANGTVLGTGTVDAQGHYSITLTTPQTAGGLLSVTQADAAGNVSTIASIDAPDRVAPLAPTATMNPGTITVTGTAEPGATVRVYAMDGTLLGGTVADADGDYSVSMPPRSFDGSPVIVRQTDAAGNNSPDTVLNTPDLAPPAAPTVTVAEDGTEVTGTGEPGATVMVFDASDGSEIGTGTVGANGTFRIRFTRLFVTGGNIEVMQIDESGNVSTTSGAEVPDAVEPIEPTATIADDGSAITGTGEAGATITVTDGAGNVVATAVVQGDGSYFVPLTPAQANGETLVVSQSDAAGNPSTPVTLVAPDLTAPGAPAAGVAADGGSISGTGEPGATVTVRDAAGNVVGTAVVAADGSYSVTLPTPQTNGEKFTVTQTDSAGNVSAIANATAPDTTVPLGLTATVSSSGTVVTGSGEPGATVTVRDPGGNTIGTATVAANGSYNVTLSTPQTNGETVQVTQADAAGNASAPVTAVAPDFTAPAAPAGTVSPNGASVSGTAEAGATLVVRDALGNVIGTTTAAADGSYSVTLTTPQTNGQTLTIAQTDTAGNASGSASIVAPDTTPPLGLTAAVNSTGTLVSGSGEPGATVTVRDPLGAAIGTATVAADGSYTVTLTTPQANGGTLQVTQADAAGNGSAIVNATAPDITAPIAPTGTVSPDGTSVTGTGEPGATLIVRDPLGNVIGTTTVLGNGSYTVTLTVTEANGETLTIVQGDTAGNVSAPTSIAAPDITAPLGLTAAVNGTGTVVNGSGEPGATVTVRDPLGAVIGTATVAANGSYSVVLTAAQANGQLLQVTQADAAGNPSAPVPAQAPDITAPDAPTATVSPDGTTVSGTGEPGATLVIRDPSGTVIGTTVVLGNGSYSATLTAAQTNGEVLSARQSDLAGNISPPVSTTAPDITPPLGLTAAVNGAGTMVSGSGEAGATVTVRDSLGAAIGTTTVAANGSYSVVLTTPQTNGELLQVTQVDGAGNPSVSVPALAPDITAPGLPVATISPDGTTVSGTGEAGATLTVRNLAGTVVGSTTVLGDGSYSVTLTIAQTNGEVLSVGQADAAGNASANVPLIAPDITAPVGLTATVNGTGTIVSGAGEAGATVTVRDPLGNVIGTATVAANGSYSVVLTTPQANGELLQVQQVDGAANPSIQVPALAPDITVPLGLTATVNGTGTSVSGSGEPGATVTVRDPLGNVVGSTTVLGDGSYTVTLTTPQANGELLGVTQADVAGNVSLNVPAQAPDITAPLGLTATVNATGTIVTGAGEAGAAITVRDPLGNVIGTATVAANGSYSVVLTTPQANGELLQVQQVDGAANPSTQVPALAPDITAPIGLTATVNGTGTSVSGSGEPGATVTVRDPLGNIVGSTTVLGDGSYTVTLTTPQANGELLGVTQADVAGNVSLNVPAQAPDITAPLGLTATVNATGTIVTGAGEAGAAITVRDPLGNVIGTATVAANGSYSVVLTTPQANGELLQVQQVDGAANPSAQVPALAPDITAPLGLSATVNFNGTSVSGTGEPGATVTVRDPLGNVVGTTTVLGDGSYEVTLTTPQANGQLLGVTQADIAGNVSLNVPTQAPDITAPLGLTATINATGTIVTGTGEAGATVTVRDPGGFSIGVTVIGANGAYAVTLTTPQANGQLLQVQQVDSWANPSSQVPVLAPDITAPGAPTLSVSPDGSTVSGSGEPGATITITTAGGVVIGSGPVAGDGTFSIILTAPQANGGTLSATQADLAGNVSLPGTAPAPDIIPPALPFATLDSTGTVVTGTGEPGTNVVIRDPFAVVIGTGTVSAAGTFSITLTVPQIDNQVIAVTLYDGANNPSPTLGIIAPDLTAPPAPTGTVAPDGGSITGNGEPGASLIITDPQGLVIGSVIIANDGSFFTSLVPPQINGEQLTLVQTDISGNASPDGFSTAPDLVPNDSPNAPTAIVAADGATVSGVGDFGNTIQVTSANGTVLGTVAVAPDGSYTVILSSAQINHETLHVVQIDAEGDLSPPTNVLAPDLTPPAAPSASIDANGATVTGTGEVGASVRVVNSLGTVLGTAVVDANGNYAVTLASPQNNGQALTVIQADAAANDSPSVPLTAPDTTAPLAPTASVAADGLTVSGTGESGATITIRDPGGVSIGTAVVTPGGTYTVTLTTPQTNGQVLTAQQADPTGNLSPTVNTTAPDLTPPAAPIVSIDATGTVVSGTGEVGATVTVRNALGVPIGSGVVAADGSFTVNLATPQLNGQALQVVQTDAAGLLSPVVPITAPDTTAPLAPTGTVSAGGTTVVGFGEPGATVTVRDAGGVSLGTATVAGNGSYTVTLSTPQTNGQLLTLSQADAAGNVSANLQVTAPDTTAPNAPTATVSGNGAVVSGTGEAGATVTVRDALGTPLGTAIVAANGSYSVVLPVPLTNGQALTVIQADAAGNVSGATPATAPDTTAPLIPTGTVSAGGTTVVGLGEPGATVTVRDAGGVSLGTALVAGNGSYTVTLSTPQTNGQQLTLSQADAAGNVSPSLQVTAPDTTAPNAPAATVSGNGAIVTGTGEPGATVTVRDALGTPLGTAVVAANGSFSVVLPVPLTNGQALSVVQADAAGNVSGATPVTAPDTTAPLAPIGTVNGSGTAVIGTGEPGATVTVRDSLGASLGTAVVAGNGSFTVTLTTPQTNGQLLTLSQADAAGNVSANLPLVAPDTTPPAAPVATVSGNGTVVTGVGEPGATVTVRDGLGASLGTATVAANGSYSVVLTTPQTNGQALQVTQADASGNVSLATPALAPDITAPAAPAGTINASGTIVTGTGEPGATIHIRNLAGTEIGTAVVAGNGSFTATLTTAQTNGQLLTLTQSDAAGNLSVGVPLTAPDTTPPAAPVATVSGTGLVVTGTGEPGATVTVRSAGGAVLGTGLVAANGGYIVTLNAAQTDGQTLQVTQADAAGNVSAATPALAPDITAPPAPTGTVSANGTAVTGTGEPGATVTVRDANGTVLGTGLVGITGTYTATLSTPQTNGQQLTLSQADLTGNVSANVPLTAPDTTVPNAPTATIGGGGTVVTGTGEPGATVTVRGPGGISLGTATVAANGSYVVTLTTPQTNGQALQVTQADAAGNVSAQANLTAPDTTPPAAPTGTVSAGGATLTGTGEPGATVTVRDAGGTVIGTALVAANGSYSATLSSPQANGQQLSITQADVAGNVSASVPVTAPDTTPPALPTASINGGGTVVTGTGEPGATVTVRDPGGTVLGTALVAANGSYAVTLSAAQTNGQVLRVTQADVAGNVSPQATTTAPDTTPPAAPSATVNATGTIVTGTGEPGATIHVRNALGTEIGTAVVAANGSYSATLTTPQANGETVSVTQNDPAGNVSPATPAVAPDITAPATPSASINGAGTVVSGTGEVGSTVEVRNAGGTLLGTTTVAANGSYAVSLSAAQTAGQALSVTLRDGAGNVSPAAPVTAPYDIAAFDNTASASVHLLPVTTNANLGSANYTALVSVGLLNLNAQVLGTPSVQFTVGAGHSMNATFTYDALLSIGVLSGYSVIIQRFNGTSWVAVDGNGSSSVLQLSLLGGDLVTNATLGAGQYRAFVAFDGALGVGLLGGLNVTGVDSDFTDVASAQAIAHSGNVITDPGPTGQVDVASPQTQVQSVTFNGVTTTIAAGGSTITGSWGTLVINQNGSYTYTPNASASAIGHVDSFTYTLIDRSDGELESATLTMTIGSPDITGAPIAVNDAAIATATYTNVVTTVPAAIDSSFATPTALVITGAQTGTVHDSFTVSANSTANVTLSAVLTGGLSLLPTYTITVTNSQGTVVGTITQTSIANLGLGTGVALNLSGLPSGTYNYTVSSTNILGLGYGTNVYVGQTVTHLNQHTQTGVTTVQGELLGNDTLGTAFVAVRMQSGGNFVEVGESPLVINGAYGTLTVNETGHYSYTPSASLAYSGTDPIDSFTYQVLQPNGTVATARLDITVDINNGVTPTASIMETHSLADAVPVTMMFAAEPVSAPPELAAHKVAAFDLIDSQDNLDGLLGQFLVEHASTADGAAPGGNAEPAVQVLAVAPVAEDPLNYLVNPSDLEHDRHQLTHVI